jgi:outer membrane protein TolC
VKQKTFLYFLSILTFWGLGGFPTVAVPPPPLQGEEKGEEKGNEPFFTLLSLLFKKNPELLSLQEEVLSSQAKRREEGYLPNPLGMVALQGTKGKNFGIGKEEMAGVMLSLSQTIPLTLSLKKEKAKREEELSHLKYLTRRRELVVELAEAYGKWLSYRILKKEVEPIQIAYRSLLPSAKELYQEGKEPLSLWVSLQESHDLFHLLMLRWKREEEKERENLKALLGGYDPLPLPTDPLPSFPSFPLPEDLWEEGVTQTTYFQMAEKEVEIQKIEERIARREFLPEPSLQIGGIVRGDLPFLFVGGIGFSIPLFPRVSLRKEREEHLVEKAHWNKKEVENRWRTYLHHLREEEILLSRGIKTYSNLRRLRESAIEGILSSYREGEVSLREVLFALEEWRSLLMEEVEYRREYFLLQVKAHILFRGTIPDFPLQEVQEGGEP